MKKIVFFAIMCTIALASCNKETDLYEGPQPVDNSAAIRSNVEKIFGGPYDPNHDWCSTTSGEVTIKVDASVKTVQVLVKVQEVTEPTASYVTTNSMKMVNQTDVNGAGTYKLNYNIPKENLGLYVAFVTDKGYMVKKVEGNSVSYASSQPHQTRGTDGRLTSGYVLPTGTDFLIGKSVDSYASTRKWIPGEKLYELNSYAELRMDAVKDADYPQYSEAFTQSFRDMVFSTFPNGREHRNLAKVKSSGYYNEFVYLNTTGNEPVIITPVYKCDNPLKYGNEVYNSELYYYYFTQDEIEKATDVVKFIESLPKYKAINFNDCFGPAEDDEIYKHGSYALLYYGPGTPEIGTKGSFYFPANVKIGFMIRANTTAEGGKKQGEVYADGRLNNNINSYDKTNFKSSKLGTDGPRAAWFTLGDPDTNKNHLLLCWESGTDADFNDVIVEVEGGIDPFIIIYYDPYSYTYCFEDREIGDYDMNDVVLTVTRIDKTHVEYAVIACGANDELYIYNIDQGDIRHDKEVHAMFGKSTDTFINTTANDVTNTVSATIEVSENFNLLNPDIQPYIYNKTSNKYVRLSAQGEEPHAIIIPGSFQYPLEQVCIKDAYKDFVEWYKDQNTDKKAWYTRPTTGYVRTR